MNSKLIRTIELNNKEINELKNILLNFYNKNYDIKKYSYNENTSLEELQNIINSQKEEIGKLNMIIDIEGQDKNIQYLERINELRKLEPDKEFSEFYHNGIIVINNNEINVGKFYIRELVNNEKEIIYSFICTDPRINKNYFNTVDDRNCILNDIFHLRDSKVFYDIYLDKNLYNNKKIILDNQNKEMLFKDYVMNKWTKEKHTLVAETMF